MGAELQGSCVRGRRAQDWQVGFRAGGEGKETKGREGRVLGPERKLEEGEALSFGSRQCSFHWGEDSCTSRII